MADAQPASNGTKSNGYVYPFDRDSFAAAFGDVKKLILDEWPDVPSEALDATAGDPDNVVELVTKSTQHSKALVRKHMAEIAEVADIDSKTLEGRMVRLLHRLEQKTEPVVSGARAAVSELETQSARLRKDAGALQHQAEDKIKDNLWQSLIAALGVGLLLGLVVGLTRGR